MPINPNALSSPEPDREPPTVGDDGQPIEQHPDDQQTATSHAPAEPPKRTRRSKAEMIADAVVPADDAQVEIKDAGTGAKVTRPWPEAVALVADGKAEFVDKTLKYAVLKQEQQRVAPAFEEKPQENIFAKMAADSAPGERETRYTVSGEALLKVGSTEAPGGAVVNWTSEDGGSGTMTPDEWELLSKSPERAPVSSNVPPEAELGDEVRVGSETLRVGHGGVLTSSPVAVNGEVVKPRRRWQRELGAGPDGAWESTVLATGESENAFSGEPPASSEASPSTNGNGSGSPKPRDVIIETERLPHEAEQVNLTTWKISTGTLEKIGLPDYSSFQIGPIAVQRFVLDDGRRTRVFLGDREVEVPTSVIEGFEVMDNTVEFINRRFRGQLVTFLESTGAIKQPTG